MKIDALNIFPVKSLAGVSVSKVEVTPFGLRNDRQWMLVDEKGIFLSQRKLPQMTMISTRIEKDVVILSHKGMDDISLSVDSNKTQEIQIWKDRCTAASATHDINDWLNQALQTQGASCVQFIPEHIRKPGQIERFGKTARHFTDGAPFLLSNTASLHALNSHLKKSGYDPVDMRHFRSNIVVSGIDAFSEHRFNSMTVLYDEGLHDDLHSGSNKSSNGETTNNSSSTLGGEKSLSFRLVDHCQRCSIITVDPDSGLYRPKANPIMQLAEINSMPGKPKAPAFGVNLSLNTSLDSTSLATLSVGQRVELL